MVLPGMVERCLACGEPCSIDPGFTPWQKGAGASKGCVCSLSLRCDLYQGYVTDCQEPGLLEFSVRLWRRIAAF